MKNLLLKEIATQVEKRGNYICFADGSMLLSHYSVTRVAPHQNNKISVYYNYYQKEQYILPSFESEAARDKALVELREILASA